MFELVLVRHGETEENINEMVSGQLPGKLTEKGINQAKSLGKALIDYNFDLVYVSDLYRTVETFEFICSTHPQENLKEIHSKEQ